MSWFSTVGESVVLSPLRSVQMLSQDGKGETEHNHVRLASQGDGAAVKVLSGNLEQGSAAGYRTEIS